MALSSQIGAVRTALKSALQARAALSGVSITRFRPSPDDENAVEAIWLEDADGEQQPAANSLRWDDIILQVVVKVRKPGDGEAVAAAAEDRALILFAEVEAAVTADHELGGVVLTCDIGRYSTHQELEPSNRVCRLEADITFQTEIANS